MAKSPSKPAGSGGTTSASDAAQARIDAMASEITAAYVSAHKVGAKSIPAILRSVRAELARSPDDPVPDGDSVAGPKGLPPIVISRAAPDASVAARASIKKPLWALDRMAVLLIGVAVGGMIGAAFIGQSMAPRAPATQAATVTKPAQPADSASLDCQGPFSPRLLAAVAKGGPIVVGVFGDSFADGLWAALYNELPKGGNYKVIQFSKQATGFTRYASLNLEDETSGQVAGQPVDIAVIDYGANDTQGIYDNSHAYELLSTGWRQVYGGRMDRMVSLLRAQGAMVYWVGLPKMRKPEYDRQISDMEVFYAQHMEALGVPYIQVEPLSVDASGEFSDYLVDPGSAKPKLMRANDGIHMTYAGYLRLANPLIARIKAYVAHAKAMTEIDNPPAAPAGAQPPASGHGGGSLAPGGAS